jgi:phosphoribosylformylglycinamidine synthase
MSAKAGCGMRIDLDKTPTRQANMKDWEILLSESQERMLIVCKPGYEKQLLAVFDKWDLPCAAIGETTDTGRLEFFHHGAKVADVPANDLVLGGGAPVYVRKQKQPAYFKKINKFDLKTVREPENLKSAARKLWSSPNIVSKKWITRQYDSMVRTGTMTTNRPSDAAVVHVKGTNKAIALSTDCNAAYVHANPYVGAMIAVAEAARNVVCAGATPVAITNCLNFGNPYNPEVYYQFAEAIRGMGDACRKFETPVTGGNVSFYNQYTHKGKTIPVYPTPTIGMLGILEEVDAIMTMDFKQPGDIIYLIGTQRSDLGCSEYLRQVKKITLSNCPYFDLEEEYQLHQCLRQLLQEKCLQSLHDISEGGLFVALMESALPRELGFKIQTTGKIRKDAYLFGESQSRAIATVKSDQQTQFEQLMKHNKFPFELLGNISGDSVFVNDENWGNLKSWKKTYDNTLTQLMQ